MHIPKGVRKAIDKVTALKEGERVFSDFIGHSSYLRWLLELGYLRKEVVDRKEAGYTVSGRKNINFGLFHHANNHAYYYTGKKNESLSS